MLTESLHFAAPWYLLLTLAAIPVLWLPNRRRAALGHSQVSIHTNISGMKLSSLIPTACQAALIVALAITAAQPQLDHSVHRLIKQSRDFVITVDVSGSMDTELSDRQQQSFALKSSAQTQTATTTRAKPTRAEAAEAGVREFLLHRDGDRVGLITFDDRCYYNEPLGEKRSVEKKLPEILYKGSGTNFDGLGDSSSEEGAIHCSIKHLRQLGKAQSQVLIMVTDGEDSLEPKRALELANELSQYHIRMYVLGVGEDWVGATKPDLQKFVESIGGKVIRVGDVQQMQDGFALIDRLEKSEIISDTQSTTVELYPFTTLACAFILIFLIGSAALLRDDV